MEPDSTFGCFGFEIPNVSPCFGRSPKEFVDCLSVCRNRCLKRVNCKLNAVRSPRSPASGQPAPSDEQHFGNDSPDQEQPKTLV